MVARQHGSRRLFASVFVGLWTLPASSADVSEAAWRIVEQTNAFRAAQGRPPQSVNPALEDTARDFARFMAASGKYGHRADGSSPAERASAHGYDHCLLLENIAYQYRSSGYTADGLAQSLFEGWKQSPEHRKNMLDDGSTETGVGLARAEDGRYFAVQLFGHPREAAIRFTVKNDAGTTIEYRAGEQRFRLPARAQRRHTVCRPIDLTIPLSSIAQPFEARPRDGAEYRVMGRPGNITVVQE
jgi:uncharacterized protein YkwD